ncbi:MAG: phage integrase N-terminal SAM-like domain-containing protein [Deltaproteobacteria bacterium]|nr:phage integrase N-terminal SAM-like domain-containing protein [Deltaproteobacteria bacterium]
MKKKHAATASNSARTEISQPTGLLEVTRQKIRLRHLSRFTEKQYLGWIRQFIRFHGKRHPKEMGEAEIEQFLSYLATSRNVAPSTQNQALNSLVFLFRHVLHRELGEFKSIRWAKKKFRIPVVLTRAETSAVLLTFKRGSVQKLIAHILYGCGLRLAEVLNLRIKDVDFGQGLIVVRDSKGAKDRAVPLPKLLEKPLKRQLEHAKRVHAGDLAAGFGRVSMPYALQRKYPAADRCEGWQLVGVLNCSNASANAAQGTLEANELANANKTLQRQRGWDRTVSYRLVTRLFYSAYLQIRSRVLMRLGRRT